MHTNLYQGSLWSAAAGLFNDVLTAPNSPDPVRPRPQLTPLSESDRWNQGIDAMPGITCAETLWRVSKKEDFFPVIEKQRKTSMFADTWYPDSSWLCAVWQMKASEVYMGDFTAKTANPVMLVNGHFDPVTPFAGPQNTSAGLEGSVLLEHGSYGHGMFSHPSLCTMHAVRDYFDKGVLPAEGTRCEPDVDVFDLDGIADYIPAKTKLKRRGMPGEYTQEEIKLLQAMARLGGRVNQHGLVCSGGGC